MTRLAEREGKARVLHPIGPKGEVNWIKLPVAVAGRVVVAMTCNHCGRLLPGDQFPLSRPKRHVKRGTHSRNKRCHECTSAASARVQKVNGDDRRRYGYQWTGLELETAARTDLTAQQVAVMLGRTTHAVNQMRHRIAHDPRYRR